jgi:uncharacterized protein (DUF952 family)
MDEYLLFHLVTKENWKSAKNNTSYQPESLKEEGFIHLSTGAQVEQSANRFFEDHDRVLMLVIDRVRLAAPIKYEDTEGTGEKFPHLQGELNMDAVIDTIELIADDDGQFHVTVEDD